MTNKFDEAMDKALNATPNEVEITISLAVYQNLKMELKLNQQALENANRRLQDANERIVEFESIKSRHLEIIQDLRQTEQVYKMNRVWIEQAKVVIAMQEKKIQELQIPTERE